MNMDQAATWLAGSILVMLGFIIVTGGVVIINNMLHKYWKPVKFFTPDSFHPYSVPPQYATEEEITSSKKFEEFKK